MWKVGDRVFAQRGANVGWFPGTVKHFDGERFYVIFDNKEDALVNGHEMMNLGLKEGQQVFVQDASVEEDMPALVLEVGEESFHLQYPTGEKKWTPLKTIRVDPELIDQPAFSLQPEEWSLGDRVWGCWFDLLWYPGIVLQTHPKGIQVLFDIMGEAVFVPVNRVRPLAAFPGEPIEARWQAGRNFFPGKITKVTGEVVHVHYDHGEEETTSIRLVRMKRDEWFPPNLGAKWKLGDRVLACWYDLFWYPGLIVTVDGRRIQVAYDDGDQALVTLDQVQPLTLGVGDQVLCRWQNGPEYMPAEIIKQEGDRYFVHYDDGKEEWTSLRMIRVER
jgi:hypothetical protein